MIEEMKEILTMVQQMPEMVVHVLLGLAVYKLVIFLGTSAGIYGTLRTAIHKLHDYKIRKMELGEVVVYNIEGRFIDREAKLMFDALMDELRAKRVGPIGNEKSRLNYIHPSDISRLLSLIRTEDEKTRER